MVETPFATAIDPIWDGTVFSLDPFVAQDIGNNLTRGLDISSDCGN